MKESYDEDLARHIGLEPYADCGNAVGVASDRGKGRPAIELRNQTFRASTLWWQGEGYTESGALGKPHSGTAESRNLSMPGNFQRENREILFVSNPSQGRTQGAEWNGWKTSRTVMPI